MYVCYVLFNKYSKYWCRAKHCCLPASITVRFCAYHAQCTISPMRLLSLVPTKVQPRSACLFGTLLRCTIRYDTRCYFNVRSKADISQLILPHGNRQLKKCKTEKLKSKKTDMLRSKVNSLGNPYSET